MNFLKRPRKYLAKRLPWLVVIVSAAMVQIASRLPEGSQIANARLGPAIPMSGSHLTVPLALYLARVLAAALLVRLTLSAFKAFAIGAGEHLQMLPQATAGTKVQTIDRSWIQRFIWAFSSRSGDAGIDDYWLPFIIGVAELSAYPVLLSSNRLDVIGGWLLIKTAGQWRIWERSRTAFNRFLVGNLCAFAISYLWLTRFVSVKT